MASTDVIARAPRSKAPKLALGPGRVVGIGLLIMLGTAALLGPAPFGLDPAAQSLRDSLQGPSASYWFGTDHLGRDMAARLLSGARLSLSLGVLSVITAAIPGIALGLLAVFGGPWADRLLGLLADAVLALPGLLLVLMLAAIAPGSWWALYVGISLTLWVEYFRYTRQRTRILVASSAVEAARLLGFGPIHILRRHIAPELTPGLLTIAAFGVAGAVTALGGLGFISVGLRPPTAEWGIMMTELLPYWREAPWLILQPVACLFVTILSLHLAIGIGKRP
jgi:peptide/nickel transport system permease protein